MSTSTIPSSATSKFTTALPKPVTLGLKKSFGFGDRLGLATPGHLAAIKGYPDFSPIFAQQSAREMERTQRSASEVMLAAQTSLAALGYDKPWGADADHQKTEEDVKKTAAAGFTFFTIDPSAHVEDRANSLSNADIKAFVEKMIQEKILSPDWHKPYLGRKFDLGSGLVLEFTEDQLGRAAVKYGRAIHYAARMGEWIKEACGDRPFEIEVSVDETSLPTTLTDHLWIGLEVRARGIPNVVSLAPRFIGEFEKGVDYKGDLAAFEKDLKSHVVIAKYCGPYKISVHSGSDKFSIYPIVGRVCGDLFHLKTAGTSYLEALRVIVRKNPALLEEIILYSAGRFDTDRKSYHLSATPEDVQALTRQLPEDLERVFLDETNGRQLLHVTFGSVLTIGKDSKGRLFKDSILEILKSNEALHQEVLTKHLDKHLRMLSKG
jgi:tagaturonate epimerase